MRKQIIDGIEVWRGSNNVFADLGLPDAEKSKHLTADLVREVPVGIQALD